MIETATIIEALHYTLEKTGTAGKIKLIKLMYLADKYHLLKYGRTVTNDDYYAMDFGPVGTTVKDILAFDKDMLSKDFKYAAKLLAKVGEHEFSARHLKNAEYEHLSETDIEVLDFVLAKFGKMTGKQLTTYTHQYPEWAQHAHLFEAKTIRRARIETEELLSVIDDNCFGITPEHLEESRKLLTGNLH